MRFQNALENAHLALKILSLAFMTSFSLNILVLLGWYHAQSKITVYVPPQIPKTGMFLQAGDYPDVSIYSFAYYVWQSLNYWSANGVDDYKQHIEQFAAFLSPRFKNDLIRDYHERLSQGELQERTRALSGLNPHLFDQADVQVMSPGVWLVHLKMHLKEEMNHQEVKNIGMHYTLRVIHQDVDVKANPWGLALDGFVTHPERIKI